ARKSVVSAEGERGGVSTVAHRERPTRTCAIFGIGFAIEIGEVNIREIDRSRGSRAGCGPGKSENLPGESRRVGQHKLAVCRRTGTVVERDVHIRLRIECERAARDSGSAA